METEGSGSSRASQGNSLNEDAYLVQSGLGLYVVCDGFSNRPAGELAAGVAIDALEEFVARARSRLGDSLRRELASRSFASGAIRYALDSVFEAARAHPQYAGMATTITMLLTQSRNAVVAHVGDSRAYLFRDDRLHLLTIDHEWTNALNEKSAEPALTTDSFSLDLHSGDTFLLCSDGAEQVVDDPDLMHDAGILPPRLLAGRIVAAAHRNDPSQDATVVVVRVRDELEPGWLSLSAIPRETEFGHALPAYA